MLEAAVLVEAGLAPIVQRAMRHHGTALVATQTSIVVIDASKVDPPRGYNIDMSTVKGAVFAEPLESGRAWTIQSLYADDPTTAVLLLYAALDKWKAVISDTQVSPAAQAVINRYYRENWDDPERIKRGVNPIGNTPATQAAYLRPPDGPEIDSLYAKGETFMRTVSKNSGMSVAEVRNALMYGGFRGFDKAHSDDKRTKRALESAVYDYVEALCEVGANGSWPGQPMRNALSPDINSREQLGAISAKAIDTVSDPDGLPDHLLDPLVDPEDCYGPVPPEAEDPYVGQDPFVRDSAPQPFSGGGSIRRG